MLFLLLTFINKKIVFSPRKMIYGIGTDIFEVSRIKAVMEQDKGFLTDVFTDDEISFCSKKIMDEKDKCN